MARFPSLVLVAALSITATSLASPAVAGGDPSPGRGPVSRHAAERALERAAGLLGETGDTARERRSGQSGRDGSRGEPRADTRTPAVAGRDVTLALRDLAVALPRLEGDQRVAAERILARPTDDSDTYSDRYGTEKVGRTCNDDICVHWVETTDDAVPGSDANLSTIPPQVTETLTALTEVHDKYVAAGYRAPKADGTRGGGPQLDAYLADTGDQSIYGYCAVDEPLDQEGLPADAYGYCTLDNDYSADQFAGRPADNLKVTAAHEYFHAIQFGYDHGEDVWLMEGSAVWAESELYPGIKDNLQYLDDSPLTSPATSLDLGTARGFYYGTWIFLRRLSEQWPERTGPLPTIVKDIWEGADTLDKDPGSDLAGVEAVQAALRERGSSWARLLPDFAAGNRRPGRTYADGRADDYPGAPLAARERLSRRDRSQRDVLRVKHLASATTAYAPRDLRRKWRLRVALDLPRPGGTAAVTVVRRNGRVTTDPVSLRRGEGVVRVPFASRRVRRVEVTVANADTRYERCWTNQIDAFSCFGNPVGDRRKRGRWIGRRHVVEVRAVR